MLAAPTGPLPRIAVCLVGFVRTLQEPQVFQSIARALHPVDASVDFYGSVSLGLNESDTAKGQVGHVPHEAIRQALHVLRPVMWEEDARLGSTHLCGLACMRQYERFERCVSMIAAHERREQIRYQWVVKARPDVVFPAPMPSFRAMRLHEHIVYKDSTAGDMVVYIPREHADNISGLLASRLAEMPSLCVGGMHPRIRCAADGTGAGCKCNYFLSGAVASLHLEMKYHRNTPHVARTPQADKIIQTIRAAKGDAMKLLHNKGQHEVDRLVVQPAQGGRRVPVVPGGSQARTKAGQPWLTQHLTRSRPRRNRMPFGRATTRLRIGWLFDLPDCTVGFAAVMDSLSYRCKFFEALNASHEVRAVMANTTAEVRQGLDLILMPHVCTTHTRALNLCFEQLLPEHDPPLVMVLNKVFDRLERKLAVVQEHRGRFALVLTASPHTDKYSSASHVPVVFMPYAAAVEFGRYHDRGPSHEGLAFDSDFGFSGGWERFDSRRYPFRALIFRGNTTARLRARGLRLKTPGWLQTQGYINTLARTRVWFATTEIGDHIGTRFFEVLISGRAMLLCDRNPTAYAPLGIVEGEHAAMFNSTQEFEEKLTYYLAHEDVRQRIVVAARRLILSQHLWSHRRDELGKHLSMSLAGYWGRDRSVGEQRVQ